MAITRRGKTTIALRRFAKGGGRPGIVGAQGAESPTSRLSMWRLADLRFSDEPNRRSRDLRALWSAKAGADAVRATSARHAGCCEKQWAMRDSNPRLLRCKRS